MTGIGGAGIYGGYFGAGLGIVLLAVLGRRAPRRHSGHQRRKNALAVAANSLAAVVFPSAAGCGGTERVDCRRRALGGQFGAQLGRRVPDAVLRGVMVAVGLTAAASVAFG